MFPSTTVDWLWHPCDWVARHRFVRTAGQAGPCVALGIMLGACQPSSEPGRRIEDATTNPAAESAFEPPDVALIAFACAGFDAAVAAEAPPDRLLSHTAKHAVELGGPSVELATRRWALLPPQGLLEEIDRYERTGVSSNECAGLRLHLERLAILSGSH
jgi:hypothetical protein